MAMTTAEQDDADRQKRRHAPKVRTGCTTCKIRRVKCDEAKPECLRCTSTGRKCDGYETPPPRKQKSTESKPRKVTGRQLTPERDDIEPISGFESPPEYQLTPYKASIRERRALEFFYSESAPQLSGCFSSAFWNGSLLQMSMSEPSIRYAMIALGTMLESEMIPSLDDDDDSSLPLANPAGFISTTFSLGRRQREKEQFATQYYSKAIQAVLTRAKSDFQSLPVIAMTCIMFICVEFLRGNVDAALTHINSGVKMIRDIRSSRTGESGLIKRSQCSSFELAFIERELVPLLGWLSIVSAVFGKPSGEIFAHPTDDGDGFVPQGKPQTLTEARAMLADVTNAAIRLLTSASQTKYYGSVSVENIAEYNRLTKLMNQLKADTEDIISRLQSTPQDTKDLLAADHMRLTLLSSKVWLSSAISPYEISWDESLDEFKAIVEIAERMIVLSLPSFKSHTKQFSFEAGIVPALHVTAWKCRHPIVRRRAAKLLFNWPRRECLFDSRHFYGVFLKLIKLEERNGTWGKLSDATINALMAEDDAKRPFSPPLFTPSYTPPNERDAPFDQSPLPNPLNQFADLMSASNTFASFHQVPAIPEIDISNIDRDLAQVVPEPDRIHHFMLSVNSAPANEILLTNSPFVFDGDSYTYQSGPCGPSISTSSSSSESDSRLHTVTFLYKPEGILGPWHSTVQAIDLTTFEKQADALTATQLSQTSIPPPWAGAQCLDDGGLLVPSFDKWQRDQSLRDAIPDPIQWDARSEWGEKHAKVGDDGSSPWGYRGLSLRTFGMMGTDSEESFIGQM